MPEKWLYCSALTGGWAGGAAAMVLFRHKVSKRRFLVRYAAAAAVHLLMVYEFDLTSKHFGQLL